MFLSTPRFLAQVASMEVSTGATGTVAKSYPKGAITSITNSPMDWRCSTALAVYLRLATHTATMAPFPTAPVTVITRTLTTTIM